MLLIVVIGSKVFIGWRNSPNPTVRNRENLGCKLLGVVDGRTRPSQSVE